ncbi:MAG: EamA family transporter [Mogibacterium sp.]|nr:EamA family transporter [Mogibacterium sp.]
MEGSISNPRDKGESPRFWAELLIVLQSIVYGFGDPVSKIAFETVPVFSMMSIRYSIAFLVCLIFFRKRITETLRTAPIRSWLLPGMCMGLCYLLNNVALSMTDATSVAFLRSLSVVITPAFASLIFKKKLRWQHLLIQFLVLPGIYMLCVRGGLSGFGLGEAVTIIAATCMAGALTFSGRYLEKVDVISMTALQAGCSALLAIAGSFIFERGIEIQNQPAKVWLIILYLAIICTFLGYLMQNLALTKISESSVAMLQSLCPVMTAFFSFLILGEKLSIVGMAGGAIIILCVIAKNLIHENA